MCFLLYLWQPPAGAGRDADNRALPCSLVSEMSTNHTWKKIRDVPCSKRMHEQWKKRGLWWTGAVDNVFESAHVNLEHMMWRRRMRASERGLLRHACSSLFTSAPYLAAVADARVSSPVRLTSAIVWKSGGRLGSGSGFEGACTGAPGTFCSIKAAI